VPPARPSKILARFSACNSPQQRRPSSPARIAPANGAGLWQLARRRPGASRLEREIPARALVRRGAPRPPSSRRQPLVVVRTRGAARASSSSWQDPRLCVIGERRQLALTHAAAPRPPPRTPACADTSRWAPASTRPQPEGVRSRARVAIRQDRATKTAATGCERACAQFGRQWRALVVVAFCSCAGRRGRRQVGAAAEQLDATRAGRARPSSRRWCAAAASVLPWMPRAPPPSCRFQAHRKQHRRLRRRSATKSAVEARRQQAGFARTQNESTHTRTHAHGGGGRANLGAIRESPREQ
jgi:hypothetical protein